MKLKQRKDYYDTEYDYLTDYILNKYVSTFEEEMNSHPLYLVEKRTPNMAESGCYARSNEFLMEYMSQLDLASKRVATVGSSGDQVLNALFYGAKDITLIDGNPYARAFVEYKMALMKNLSYQEFISLFLVDAACENELFSYKTYRKISHDLSKPVQQFWDRIILEQSPYSSRTSELPPRYLRNRMLLVGGKDIYSEFYQSEQAYKKLQKILIDGDYKINYVCSEFSDFDKNLEGEFDILILSNIFDYVGNKKFVETVRNLYNNKLNDGGKIQVHYELGLKSGKDLKSMLSDLDFEKISAGGDCAWIINKPKAMKKNATMEGDDYAK